MKTLILAEAVLLGVVLLFVPLYWICASRKHSPSTGPKLKGLGLPEGSIRGMLALISVGSFVILLVLGPVVLGSGATGGSDATGMKEFFDKSLAAFGTLTGAIIGFYFGNRGTGVPEASPPPTTEGASKGTEGGASTGPTADAASTRSPDSAPSTPRPE